MGKTEVKAEAVAVKGKTNYGLGEIRDAVLGTKGVPDVKLAIAVRDFYKSLFSKGEGNKARYFTSEANFNKIVAEVKKVGRDNFIASVNKAVKAEVKTA